MNEREAMSFKALLRRIAAEENIPAQVVLLLNNLNIK
jgi:hypothetical protein